MNNKILLGSIIAVVILVLVSFTGVVGYQTTKSSAIAKTSPLFSVRSRRAIGEESKDLSCDYVGKGEESVLSIPKRDGRTILLQKVIDIISRMNDIEINQLMSILFKQKDSGKNIENENINEFQKSIFKLRDVDGGIGIFMDEKDKETLTWVCPTVGCISIDVWRPGCYLVLLMFLIFLGIENIIGYFTTYAVPCFTEYII